MEKEDGSFLFKQNSSFIPIPCPKDSELLSLRSFNKPKIFIRHKGGRIIISYYENKGLFLKDATWRVIFIS